MKRKEEEEKGEGEGSQREGQLGSWAFAWSRGFFSKGFPLRHSSSRYCLAARKEWLGSSSSLAQNAKLVRYSQCHHMETDGCLPIRKQDVHRNHRILSFPSSLLGSTGCCRSWRSSHHQPPRLRPWRTRKRVESAPWRKERAETKKPLLEGSLFSSLLFLGQFCFEIFNESLFRIFALRQSKRNLSKRNKDILYPGFYMLISWTFTCQQILSMPFSSSSPTFRNSLSLLLRWNSSKIPLSNHSNPVNQVGQYMKSLEQVYSISLDSSRPFIVRLDGSCFSTFTSSFEKVLRFLAIGH
jgi:hypothetical protein